MDLRNYCRSRLLRLFVLRAVFVKGGGQSLDKFTDTVRVNEHSVCSVPRGEEVL